MRPNPPATGELTITRANILMLQAGRLNRKQQPYTAAEVLARLAIRHPQERHKLRVARLNHRYSPD